MSPAPFALHGVELSRRHLGDMVFSVTRYERGAALPLHGHETSYATVVVSGGYCETSSGHVADCVAGSIIVHASGELHADRFKGPTTCLNIQGRRFERSGMICPDSAAGIAAKLRREFLQPDAFSEQVVEALMMELDALSRRHAGADRLPQWLHEVWRCIESQFRGPLTESALADAAGVHPTHLARSFRRHFRMTVGERLRELRVADAKRRLAAGDSLSEIATETGFADQSHFTRTFRRATGTTPSEYRRVAGLRRSV